ncbi:hypothetical protein D3C74_423910 [compost metagenome]
MHPGDFLGVGEQTASGVGKNDLFADAVKQRLVQLCFKRLNLRSNAGLRIIQLLRGAGEASRLHYFKKGEQMSGLHSLRLLLSEI